MGDKWYIKDNIGAGEFINIVDAGVETIELDEETIHILKDIFDEPFFQGSSRCISFYRDTIVLDGTTYHICLSCGDVSFDGEQVMLTRNQELVLKDLKQKLRGKTTARDFIANEERRFPAPDELMIKFARFHLEQFKKEIQKKGFNFTYHNGWDWTVDTEGICNLYPNENIK